MIMRIYMNNRNKYQIENNLRVSKYNYRSRPNYSIKMAILEKQLIYDASSLNLQQITCNITDLEA